MLERTEPSLSAIAQRTMTTASDPFVDMSDADLEKIANAISNATA